MEAHPDAAIFPMMSADELADLAEDIKVNGQRFPIVIAKYEDREVIIDGRNRYEACEIAGVEPKFQQLNGHDPKAFILSANINRRHMNAGQRAMAVAMLYPEPASRDGRGKKSITTTQHFPDFSRAFFFRARFILRDSRALAEEVMSGIKFLDSAYKEAKARAEENKRADEDRDRLRNEAPDLLMLVLDSRATLDEAINLLETRKQDRTKLDTIKDGSPDLVKLVEEGRMSVQDAMAAHDKRHEEERNARSAATALLAAVVRLFDAQHVDPQKEAERLVKHFDPHLWPAEELGEPTSQLFQTCSDVLAACARLRKKQETSK